MKRETQRALHAEWRKFSPNLDSEPSPGLTPEAAERELRLQWTNQQLKRRDDAEGGHWTTIKGERVFIEPSSALRAPIDSWKKLTEGEARYLLRLMRELSGEAASYRGLIMAQLALELWGHDWDEFLRDRIQGRYHVARPSDLSPAQARAFIEELASRVGRGRGETMETVRHRVIEALKNRAIEKPEVTA